MKKFYFLFVLLCAVLSLEAADIRFPETEGYTLDEKIDYFDGASLFNQINGAAAVYLDYGFTDMHHAVYRSNENDSYIVAEAYRHKNPDYAYGMYALERTGSTRFTDIGAQAYVEEGVLNVYGDVWYLKLYSHQKDEKTAMAMGNIARGLEKELFPKAQPPEEIAWFPEELRTVGSELFVVKDVLGLSFLTEAYAASYKNGSYDLFLFKKGSPAEAGKMVADYCAWAKTTVDVQPGKIVSIPDKYNGTVHASVKGSYVVLLAGIENAGEAQTIMNGILEKIR
ncbi:MAG: hypothetical protein PUB21_03135 [Bacteroidales bacterium]|nr:hypothetical protein [Bacteroidales bacterium]